MKNNRGITKITVIMVSIAMIIVTFHLPTVSSSAEEDSDLVKAPDWHEGDEWKYKAVYGEDEEDISEVTERVKRTNVPIDPNLEQGDVSYDETYHLVREGDSKLHRYYEKDSLSLIFEDSEGSAASFYKPPRKNFNFPFEVGDEWEETTKEYVGSLEDSDDFTHDKSWFIEGKVERNHTFSLSRTEYNASLREGQIDDELAQEFENEGHSLDADAELSKEDKNWTVSENGEEEYMIEVGEELLKIYEEKPTITVNGEKYDTYKLNVNFTAVGGNEDWSLGRIEYYYSPEVKNTVLKNIYETRKDPQTDQLQERHMGNEELLDYEIQEGSDGDKDEKGLILSNPMFLILVGLVVGTAVIYFYKKGQPETKS